MRTAHTVDQIRRAEQAAMSDLPEGALMRRAAAGIARVAAEMLDGAAGARVLLLVGSGNNGGDALFAGADLARRGATVAAIVLGSSPHPAALAAFTGAGGRVLPGSGPDGFRADLVIDGIVGIGGRPGLRPEAERLVDELASAADRAPVLAVDVPSGVDVESGEVPGACVTADRTVTFGSGKPALLVDPAARHAGRIELIDLGLDLTEPPIEALDAEDVAALLPVPGPDDHKYTRGVVGIVAGSAQFPGAGILSVGGADTGLIGMVRYLGPEPVARLIHARYPEVVAAEGRVQAWVVGSGAGDDAAASLRGVLDAAAADRLPVVVDADALTSLDPDPLPTPAVLTPHAGELAGMLGEERAVIEAAPLHWARRAAAEYRAVVLLKGGRTVIARPDGRVRVNTESTPWLATAGAGDVLGGLIGALLAAGLDPFDAASAGAWLHARAAISASAGGPIVASDLAPAVPGVVRRLLADREWEDGSS